MGNKKIREWYILDGVIKSFTGVETEIIVPTTLYGKPVTTIGKYAFSPEADVNGEKKAFRKTITKITIEEGISKIEDSAFEGCTSLREIVIPKSVTEIGNAAFARTAIESIEIPPNILWSAGMFEECRQLKTIEINNKYVPWRCFRNCSSLERVELSSTIEKIGESAFYGCKSLKDITFPASLKNICEFSFRLCESLSSVYIPNGINMLPKYCFADCSNISRIRFPLTIKSIEEAAFAGCKSLETISLPEGTEEIKIAAFSKCGLIDIEIPESVDSFNIESIKDCESLKTITFKGPKTKIIENYGRNWGYEHAKYRACYQKNKYLRENWSIIEEMYPLTNSFIPSTDLVIRGNRDSTAEEYANKYNLKFELLN